MDFSGNKWRSSGWNVASLTSDFGLLISGAASSKYILLTHQVLDNWFQQLQASNSMVQELKLSPAVFDKFLGKLREDAYQIVVKLCLHQFGTPASQYSPFMREETEVTLREKKVADIFSIFYLHTWQDLMSSLSARAFAALKSLKIWSESHCNSHIC